MVIPLKLVKSGEESQFLAQGWIKQTTINEPRLSEIAENYRQLGYEVHVVEHRTAEGCNTCFTAGAEAGQFYGDIYVRKGSGKPPDDELF